MRMRAPSVPLITVDPYFSVWSPFDRLTDGDTTHWTDRKEKGKNRERPMKFIGIAEIDGNDYRFMGSDPFPGTKDPAPALKQTALEIEAFTSIYSFEGAGVGIKAAFTTPVMPDDFYYLSRPVSYLEIKSRSLDGKKHKVYIKLAVSEQICLDAAGEDEVLTEEIVIGKVIKSIRIGSRSQKVLWRDGDDVRIDWGYFYLSTNAKNASVGKVNDGKMTYVTAEADCADRGNALFTFAYDDIKSIKYFGRNLPSYWNRNGEKITDEILRAHNDYNDVMRRVKMFSDTMFADAVRAGGEKYAELLLLGLRQTIAAHKIAVDENGEILFISKECFSNGCAATVDVSYPSIPLFLIYNPELVRGMMRPIYRYAATDEWNYDFAPHDAGKFPIVDGQRYGKPQEGGRPVPEMQMPVEECGNMLIMEAAAAKASGDYSFARKHLDVLRSWVKYLLDNGSDPENQLCTDDFAGHLAHNCNLSLKAIMGIACYGMILENTGSRAEGKKFISKAKTMALDWAKRASNGDGTYRLAFDVPDSYSMKYNIVWDKLFGLNIMPCHVIESEFAGYSKRMLPYGMPLDCRDTYTKSDWLVWTATLTSDRDAFERFVEPLWKAYNFTPDRVPMTDFYFTGTGCKMGFQHRSVIGGLYIKLLEYRGILKD